MRETLVAALCLAACASRQSSVARIQERFEAGDFATAAQLGEDACRRDESEGCAKLGFFLFQGLGVPKDVERGQQLLQKACDQRIQKACHHLAVSWIQLGELVRATALLEPLCHEQVPDSCYNLAVVWIQRGDHSRAAQLLEPACERRESNSCFNLAALTFEGLGVRADPDKAILLHRRGCENGDRDSCFRLGELHRLGSGMPKDDAAAGSYYQRACDRDHHDACYRLAYFFLLGDGRAVDPEKAAELFAKACKLGSTDGCANHAIRELDAGHTAEAIELLQKSCDGEAALACGVLGHVYESGRYMTRDAPRAAGLFKRACDAGDEGAPFCLELAKLFAAGDGVATSATEATRLWARGCASARSTCAADGGHW